MKKFIFSAIAAIGLLLSPSCSDENEALSGSGNEALVSFSVNLADGIQTKAIGDGETATTLHVDVYEVSNGIYTKIDALSKDETLENLQQTVNMTLVKGKEYGFVFWAQSPQTSIYSVGDQTISVNYTNPLCNKEKYDAFFATDQFVAKQSFNREVILRRPLAQLNYLVSESDLTAAENQRMNLNDLQTSIWISNAATQLHPFTNTVSGGGSAVTFTATKLQNLSTSNSSKQYVELPKIDGTLDENGQPEKEKFYYLATTYFLVKAGDETKDSGKNSQAVVDTKLTINGLQADDYALSVQNVPVQWNHRTNIYGNLLTASGQFVVKINPLFEDEDINLPNVETVSSVNEMLTALENGSTTIKAAADFVVPEDGVIPLPKNSDQNNTEEVSFDFSAITNNSTLTFEETTGNKEATAKNVSIIANGIVVINLPRSTVTLNGEAYEQVTATTDDNSLYIERGVTVNKLIAKKGNVHIKGTIGEFTKGEGYGDKIYYYISTAEQLKEFAGVVNGTVPDGLLKSIYSENPVILLDEDIDLRNEDWTPIGGNTISSYPSPSFSGTFDGQNHTISNLTTSSNQPGYATAGLFGTVANATIKNVKLSNVNVSSTHYVGAIVGYHSDGTFTIENCHVDGGTITSTIEAKSDGSYDNGDKAGGIVGHMSATGSVNDCSVNNVTIQGYRELGGIVGYAGSKDNVTGCQVSNVTLIQDNTYAYKEDVPTTLGALVGGSGAAPYVYYDGDYASAVTKIHIAGTAAIFKSVLAAAGSGKGDQTIFITNDIDFTNADFLPVNVDGYNGAGVITVEGNNHKLTNLSAPLFAGGFAGNSGIVIKNLSIENSNITSTNSTGSGAFIESVDSQPKIELNNCHLRNSSVSGSRTGGLIGWTSGYNNENDGPVKTYVNILNCSVENSTITGSSVGGINGHAGANAWTFTTITNCTVTGCTLNSTDDGDWRVGIVVGTANVGEVTISNITESGNTLTQDGKTAPSHSNLYGRFVPQNGSGKLTIDGVEITQ